MSTSTAATVAAQPKPTALKPPPVTLPASSHLDPGAYVRGTYPITIGQNVLIHPRAHLLSVHAPLIVGDGCIVGEKCVLGGPVPAVLATTISGSDSKREAPETLSASSIHASRAGETAEHGNDEAEEEDEIGLPTIIEPWVHIHPNATVHHNTTVGAYSIIESNALINRGAKIGPHSKICSNLTISDQIPGWTVVWGSDGDQKRRLRRTQPTSVTTATDERGIANQTKELESAEKLRLRAMDAHRDGTIALFKANAVKAASAGGRSKR